MDEKAMLKEELLLLLDKHGDGALEVIVDVLGVLEHWIQFKLRNAGWFVRALAGGFMDTLIEVLWGVVEDLRNEVG
jgi:hypothetical protein